MLRLIGIPEQTESSTESLRSAQQARLTPIDRIRGE